jgi:hypothetical protein
VDRLRGDVELLCGGGPILLGLRPAGGEGAEVGLRAPEVALECVQLQGRGVRSCGERAGADTQPRSLGVGAGGVGGERDRDGCRQGKTRQDGPEARQAPR